MTDRYYDFQFELIEAIERVLRSEKLSLPIVKEGWFGDRDPDHIYIAAPTGNEQPIQSGGYVVDVLIGVATLKERPVSEHRERLNSLFNVVRRTDLKDMVTAQSDYMGCNQTGPSTLIRSGELNEAMRFTEMEIPFRVYGKG